MAGDMTFVNFSSFPKASHEFSTSEPFNFCIIDNFFKPKVAKLLEHEFPDYESDKFNGLYNNAIEIKKSCNIWDRFPTTTYKVLFYLNSQSFINRIAKLTGIKKLYADFGLHGGGWHIHPPGGKLNVHLDYDTHPKLELQRKLNLLIYLNSDYKSQWGGNLGLWSHNKITDSPQNLVHSIEPIYNRAVLFDTTQNSWHGLEVPNQFPSGQNRKSIALYYLVNSKLPSTRQRALFVPSKDQEGDTDVLELIKRRSVTVGDDPTKWSRS